MSFSDPHDPRRFNRFAQLADDGSVAAIIEVAVTAAAPAGRFVHYDVTDQMPCDVTALVIPLPVLTVVRMQATSVQRTERAAVQAAADALVQTATAHAALRASVAVGTTAASLVALG